MSKQVRVGAGVMIFNRENKILLGKRFSDLYDSHSECWSAPGGKVEYGESLIDCAIREVKEETNLDIKSVEVFCMNNEIGDNVHAITIGLKANTFSGKTQTTEPGIIGDWQWFSLDDLPKPLFRPTQTMIDCYKQGKFNLLD